MLAAVIWVAWNLVFNYFLLPLFPENIIHFTAGMWMPALSALIFLRVEGIPLGRGTNWSRGSFHSYLWAALYPITVAVLTVCIGLGMGKLSWSHEFRGQVLSGAITLLIWFIASLGEEIGWRGYLYNHLGRTKHSPLIIGLIWGAWHYQLLWSENHDFSAILSFTALTILLSYFLCWLIEIGGSVLTCAFFHGFWDFLRIYVLFGNPAQGKSGLFFTSAPNLTEMEGVYGVIVVAVISIPFLVVWYWRTKANKTLIHPSH